MVLEQIFRKIHFVERYKEIFFKHNDYVNGLSGSNKKLFLEILKKVDSNFVYISKDRFFKLDFKLENIELNFGIKIKDGLIEPFLFFIKDNDWLLYNRFDFISEELSPGFREKFNIPTYTSEAELEIILKEIFSIYQDVKTEFIKEF